MKKLIFPVAVVLIAASAAFATKAAKNTTADVVGYRFDSETATCINSEKECSTVGSIMCTWNDGATEHNLYQLNGTVCSNPLFEKP